MLDFMSPDQGELSTSSFPLLLTAKHGKAACVCLGYQCLTRSHAFTISRDNPICHRHLSFSTTTLCFIPACPRSVNLPVCHWLVLSQALFSQLSTRFLDFCSSCWWDYTLHLNLLLFISLPFELIWRLVFFSIRIV